MLLGLLLGLLLALLAVRALGLEQGTLLVLLLGALPFVLLPAYPLLLVAVALRARLLSALALVVVAGHLAVVAPALGPDAVPAGADRAPRLRVVTANLYVLNPDPAAAGRALRALRPDVLVVPELTPAGLAGLEASGLLRDLPHRLVGLDGRPEGVGLLSRLPLRDRVLRPVGPRLLPRATVRVGGVDVRLLTAHPLPPFLRWEGLWRAALRDLAQEVRGVRLPVVVAGDLNADRDQAPFRGLLRTGLRDAADARGAGLVRTWPVGRATLHLDHVLTRGAALVPLEHRVVEVPGSDHHGVLSEIAVLR